MKASRTARAALDRLRRREVELRPAQDHGIATPLAQVVSAGMPLLAVRLNGRTGYAPVIEGHRRRRCASARRKHSV